MSKGKPFGGRYREAVEGYAAGCGLTRTQVDIASAVASFANIDTGLAWPGNPKIAARARISEKTLERHLPVLKQAGVLIPHAYPKGGAGKAVEYRFPVKQYSGHQRDPWQAGFEQAENHRQNDGGSDVENHRHSVPKPPTFSPKTTDKLTEPSREKKKEEEIRGTAGRREALQEGDATRREELRLLSQWTDQHGFGEAQRMVDAWKSNQTVAAE
ncbi:MAG: hypothetical protein ACRBB0_08200 [Pelagimonas sp.]|uniref:hypothetical protein n=1 Tax=Pelagimonas sp. TaxID=2073170 RepID=UPI003D6B659E